MTRGQWGWFGKHWGAPICNDWEHMELLEPVQCGYCGNMIQPGEDGLMMPIAGRPATPYFVHADCNYYSVAGSRWCAGTKRPSDGPPQHQRWHALRDSGMRPREAEEQVLREMGA